LPIRELESTDLAPSPLKLIDISDETHASYFDRPVIATQDLDRVLVVLTCALQDEDGFVSPRRPIPDTRFRIDAEVLSKMRIPSHSVHPFRSNPYTDSDVFVHPLRRHS
jgi:hypothetical protein